MIPIKCGEADRSLLGLYDPPGPGSARDAVVICNPWAGEYFAAYRVLRFLARRLSRAGHHVLRFDYYGCGDSGGVFTDGTVEGWSRDAATAVEELRAVSGARRTTVLGARGGALIASRLASRRSDVHRIVMWDPVLDGAAHLEASVERARREGLQVPPGWPLEGGTAVLDGHLFTDELGRSILEAGVDVGDWEGVRSLLVVASASSPDAYGKLLDRAEERGVTHELLHRPWPTPWGGQEDFLAGALPVEAVEAIVEALA